MPKELQKVPLQLAWLSENGLLDKAATVLGNVNLIGPRPVHTNYDEFALFTVAQLLELGAFEPGEFNYCPHCKRLQVDCDAEMRDIDELNNLEAYNE